MLGAGCWVLGAADCILQKSGSGEATLQDWALGKPLARWEPGAGGSACTAVIGDALNLTAGQSLLFDHQFAISLFTPALSSQSMVLGFCPSSWLSPSCLEAKLQEWT